MDRFLRHRVSCGEELHIPDGIFSIADLEQANGHLGPIAIKTQFVRAIVDGRVEVVETPGADGKAFTYRKSEHNQ